MKVTFETLNSRDNVRLVEISTNSQGAPRPWVTEMDALKITLHLTSPAASAKLIISDAALLLDPADDAGMVFSCWPERRPDGRYKSLFYNYFGIAPVYAATQKDGSESLTFIGELEVLARKASVDQTVSMVRFVLESGNIDLLRNFSATKHGAGPSDESGLPANRLIEHLEDVLRVMENTIPIIVRNPIHSLTSELIVISNPKSLDIQDQGVAWLCENLGVLEPSDDIEDFMMIYSGQRYRATSIQSPVTRESLDVYENRVIHGFIESCITFVHSLQSDIVNHSHIVTLNKSTGYESFFNVMSEWIQIESKIHTEKLTLILSKLKTLKIITERKLSVTQKLIEPPNFTPKARANRNYSSLYRVMHEWYRNTKVDWSAEKFLMAINSIPKLFELYSVLLISKWLKNNGKKLNTEQGEFFSAEINDKRISLKYEPEYWRTRHAKANEKHIVCTQIKTADESFRHWSGRNVQHSGAYQLRSPDIVLECSSTGIYNELEKLVILDAKYVNRKKAFEEKLSECTMKYVHGLTSKNKDNIVSAMIILYPDGDGPWLDFHAWDYGLFGKTPQLPALGALGLLGTKDQSTEILNRVMSRLTLE